MADNSSNSNKTLNKEEVDIRILRLLGIQEVFDIDYDTYISLLKEQLVLLSIGKRNIPREEEVLLQNEYKRVKNKKGKGRFKPKKKITADSFKRGGAIVKVGAPKKSQLVEPKKPLIPGSKSGSNGEIKSILDSLSNIVDQLKLFNNFYKNDLDKQRKEKENLKRKEREGDLENRFGVIEKAVEKVISPVKSVLQRIIDALLALFIGRSLILLLEWLTDKKNQDKVKAIGRFLGDHWPKLLALYIAFGTGLGKFVRGLVGVVIKGTGALIKAAVGLAARAGLKRAGKLSKFLGGPKGKLIGAGIEAAAVAGGTLALSKGIEDFGGLGGGENEKAETPPVAKYSGGGFANLKNIFKGSLMGSIFGPMGMLAGAGIGALNSGLVSGQKGVDKVPAMLTDGEFVMSRGAVQKYGVDTLEAMNAAGGGTNKPKVVKGTTYAQGGGLVGKDLRSKLRSSINPLIPDVSEGLRTQKFTTLWHGTSDIFKNLIEKGGIDPKKYTFGALGEGFYTTTDKAIARLYADQAARSGGGKPAMVRLQVPTEVLKKYTADVRKRGVPLTGNELIQYSRIRPSINGNTHTGPMHVWGGMGKLTPEGFGPRIGNVGKGGLNLEQQYKSANLANRFGKTGPTPSIIKSSQAPQRWAEKFIRKRQSPIARSPIPPSSAIVPYTGGGGMVQKGGAIVPYTGGLSTDVKPPIQQIRTNMNVPGGFGKNGPGILQAIFAAMEFDDRKKSGQTNVQAALGTAGSTIGGTAGWMAGVQAGAVIGGAIGTLFGGIGAAPGAAVGALVGGIAGGIGGASFGGKIADDFSGVNSAKEKLSRGGIGGAIKGGWGLKEQSFKDAPKTQVMVDERTGQPFVGHKAMRNGKLTYVRPSKPGTGTTNPLEALGRMINPGAYKENDRRLALKNQRIAMVNALESFQAQNMAPDAQARMMKKMGGNLKDVQNDLNYRKKTKAKIASGELKPNGKPYTAKEQMRMKISKSQKKVQAPKPAPKKPVKVSYTEKMKKRRDVRNAGTRKSTPKVPPFTASSQSSTRKKTAATYGIG